MTINDRFIVASEVATYLSVGAGVTFSSYLSVAGDTTLSSSLSVSNRVVLSSTLSVAAHVQLSSHLSVAGSADVTGRVYQATHMLVPPGSVVAYIASSAPGGWLLCDGSAVSRSTYSTLFGVIGTTYGVGDNSTTFNLPDLRGRVPVGSGTGAGLTARSLAATGGAETHTLTVSEIPAHTHSYVNNTNNQGTDNAFATETAADDADLSATTGSTGGGQAHNNMQPFLVLNYIIKY